MKAEEREKVGVLGEGKKGSRGRKLIAEWRRVEKKETEKRDYGGVENRKRTRRQRWESEWGWW